MRLLLIEDSVSLRRTLSLGLEKLGYMIDATGDGAEGLSMALLGDYELIILDLMLPEMDGMSILKALRKSQKDTRVLILSAKAEHEDKVGGLLAGADDYLSKPFSFDELHARLINLMRRGKAIQADDKIQVGDFELDIHSKSFCYQGQNVDLTPNEYRILECLFLNKTRVVTSEKMSEYIAGHYDFVSKNAIEAHLSSARKKVRTLGADLPVRNKRGFGYIVTEN
ncbi:response regulator transcription factor [Neptunicella marina]|uniref:Response regulator transcription factor n=1 Tax=Neptunicella marina TaxID=2125989 RepID=A0A8J6IWT0_9ALTE|nr:response regulator transcription factor [Neptunicella marina]MBC3767549.1 response regulator transcription factor [Neptunicella marina]